MLITNVRCFFTTCPLMDFYTKVAAEGAPYSETSPFPGMSTPADSHCQQLQKE